MDQVTIIVPITPEMLGFTTGTEHPIYGFDHQYGEWWKAGDVRIERIADNHLLRVIALVPINDAESGDFYPAGTSFTAYNTRNDADEPVLTFVPCLPSYSYEDWDDEGGTFSSSLPDEYHQFRDAPDDGTLPI